MNGKRFIGFLLVLFGLGFLLKELINFDFNSIISKYWPLLLIFIGFLQLFNKNSSFIGGLILVLFGSILLLNKLGIIDDGFRKYFWPGILILMGLSIALPLRSKGAPTISRTNDDDIVNYFTVFSGVGAKNYSRQFRGGSITAIFGGANVDLRNAVITPEGATLDVVTLFGGAELKVPEGWKVVVHGVPIFGGWDNKTMAPLDSNFEPPVLKIKCVVAFGGFEVKN